MNNIKKTVPNAYYNILSCSKNQISSIKELYNYIILINDNKDIDKDIDKVNIICTYIEKSQEFNDISIYYILLLMKLYPVIKTDDRFLQYGKKLMTYHIKNFNYASIKTFIINYVDLVDVDFLMMSILPKHVEYILFKEMVKSDYNEQYTFLLGTIIIRHGTTFYNDEHTNISVYYNKGDLRFNYTMDHLNNEYKNIFLLFILLEYNKFDMAYKLINRISNFNSTDKSNLFLKKQHAIFAYLFDYAFLHFSYNEFTELVKQHKNGEIYCKEMISRLETLNQKKIYIKDLGKKYNFVQTYKKS
jgi:hypothetical protein